MKTVAMHLYPSKFKKNNNKFTPFDKRQMGFGRVPSLEVVQYLLADVSDKRKRITVQVEVLDGRDGETLASDLSTRAKSQQSLFRGTIRIVWNPALSPYLFIDATSIQVVKKLYAEGPVDRFVVYPTFLECLDEKAGYGDMSPGSVFNVVAMDTRGEYITTQAVVTYGPAREYHVKVLALPVHQGEAVSINFDNIDRYIRPVDDDCVEVDGLIEMKTEGGATRRFQYGYEVLQVNFKQMSWLDGPLPTNTLSLFREGLGQELPALWTRMQAYLTRFEQVEVPVHTRCKLVAGLDTGECGYIRRVQDVESGKLKVAIVRADVLYETEVPFGHIRMSPAVGDEVRAVKRNGVAVRGWVKTIGEVLMAVHDVDEDDEVAVLQESVQLCNL